MDRTVRLINLKNQRIISDKCIVAESFFTRLRGWIGKTRSMPGEGILFPRCSSVHMWFMSIPIDVVFLRVKESMNGNTREVVGIFPKAMPWKGLPVNHSRANETLELPVGSIERLEIKIGDEICFG